jgi:hypothetical protein
MEALNFFPHRLNMQRPPRLLTVPKILQILTEYLLYVPGLRTKINKR